MSGSCTPEDGSWDNCGDEGWDDAGTHMRAYELYVLGHSYREIARELGVGKSTAARMIRLVLDGEFGEVPDEDVDYLRGIGKFLRAHGLGPGDVLAWLNLPAWALLPAVPSPRGQPFHPIGLACPSA